MSSNGFLNGPEIAVSFATSPLRYCWRNPYISLGVNSAGQWFCRSAQGRQPVVLLHHKSIWLHAVAGLTVMPESGCAAALWLVRRSNDTAAWRRLRARVLLAQGGPV